MDADIEGDTPCSSMAVESIVHVGTAGALWGLCTGPYDATKSGLNGFARASFVAKSIGKTGAQCGLFAGMFTMTRCVIQNYRGRSDVFNAAAAGAVVGALIASGTQSRKQVVGMAALLSILGAAADYSRTL
ncbi:outer envelope pore protein 16-4, chloroplastic [Amaranthus tricolor]|uniref:outer envelope pore protein 16-4, chloroplastic n=1 Tax=Amaranthus tricolor TaxID=29722 RepID=UPI00258284BF|nr:outer envelope pore protein 16-4, chloroplastic [Amaranthus tricolor]